MNRQTANELRFAYKVKQALNESSQRLPAAQLERLAAARKAALHVQKPERRVAQSRLALLPVGAGGSLRLAPEPGFWSRLGLALSLIVLVGTSVVGLYRNEQDKRINDLAEIDTGVLVDDIPISAYADHGFNAYLKRVAQRSQ